MVIRTDFLGVIQNLQFPSLVNKFGKETYELIKLAESFPHGVEFEHVKGHDGDYCNEKVSFFMLIYIIIIGR